MRRESVLMVATFVTCALGGILWNGCDPCECPGIPRLHGRYLADSGPPLAVMPESGSLQVTGDTVVVEYQQAGVSHRVVYDVLPRE